MSENPIGERLTPAFALHALVMKLLADGVASMGWIAETIHCTREELRDFINEGNKK